MACTEEETRSREMHFLYLENYFHVPSKNLGHQRIKRPESVKGILQLGNYFPTHPFERTLANEKKRNKDA
ncbi:hypothetical protein JTE90_009003 [Oedothorax gibbosus]|uniref:Uncharacterized protein n=1 Tax=Oedothorax gibbosus TaxID=931172 RepID=A0AAV6VLZ0_9ARAC|nr:hypothetical protein JTE90_009003 [Oedothorax gibbosus]